MKNYKQLFSLVFIAAILFGCKRTSYQADNPNTLKEVFKDDFFIGTALSNKQINKTDTTTDSLISTQFNAITAENTMKAGLIHPVWGKFNFDAADKFVEYGKINNMYIVGHTLIWHSQLPPFVHTITNADSLKQFMELHIQTVGQRYASSIDSWDVVNEALNEDGTWRESVFYKLLGEDYIVEAFREAAKAAPNSALYYNDYNIEQPQKRAGTIKLIKKLQEAGVRIDGVGIQGHWNINNLPLNEIEESILEYSKLGVKVAITELDLGVLPNPWDLEGADVNQQFDGSVEMNPYPVQLPDSVSRLLADSYEQLFRLFLKHRDKISRVTLWGVNDGHSWLNNWPIRGRTNYPLLFDRNNQPKEAFQRIISIKNNSN
ncbi:endo-1,4-beta-xylanase [Albibacterium bauzanense]|uniref:Beta-xylanase n=1 Tax=Albibacterium bauzanense TaxID=653929 RepID=A0A4R1M2C3_9SPHI|nr:endo-1,4-beta-xylanase [Albibacterium bauzanense]TCK85875.1 endo-1,4-beta-xylanase [Albibacterium bauzanense]